jgi:formate hydrogenlyase subunit 3/multisubunit Na+/H+ antiporter MnhD subunit
MSFAYFSPTWFHGIDIGLELFFAVISLVIALFALKVWRISGQRQVKQFGVAFMFISLSYVIQTMFNLFILTEMREQVHSLEDLAEISLFHTIGGYAYILAMTIGLIVLVYMSMKTRDYRTFLLLAAASALILILSSDTLASYFLLATIFLLFICSEYVRNYLRKRRKETLMVAVAFVFLLLRSIQFLFAAGNQTFYVIGRVLELFAYLLIIANLVIVLRKK